MVLDKQEAVRIETRTERITHMFYTDIVNMY